MNFNKAMHALSTLGLNVVTFYITSGDLFVRGFRPLRLQDSRLLWARLNAEISSRTDARNT